MRRLRLTRVRGTLRSEPSAAPWSVPPVRTWSSPRRAASSARYFTQLYPPCLQQLAWAYRRRSTLDSTVSMSAAASASSGERMVKLRLEFEAALDGTIKNSYDHFPSAFANVSEEKSAALRLAFTELMAQVRASSLSEFDEISKEHGVEGKLAHLDSVCKDKGIALKSQPVACTSQAPAAIALAQVGSRSNVVARYGLCMCLEED
eukprot:scaffold3415_cov368-Prasinococcus_capsulatus_cf.AAC.6